MGIFINLSISKSVTKEEWEKVYEETLQLIKHLPFAERRKIKIHDIDTICLVRTEEQENKSIWNPDKTKVGWNTIGDYDTMHIAENYYLPRDLVEDNEVELDAGDAMLGVLPSYINYDPGEERFSHVYDIWGNKTQGEPYHIYLLAVAALIEARLGTKAFTYGDITRGQFKKAVEIANTYLYEPIDIPDRCDMERLLKRTTKLPLSPMEQLSVFEHFYLGTQDAEFGTYMRQMFPDDIIEEYWKSKFRNREIGTIGFNNEINDYLMCGFDLGKLCDYVNYVDEDGNPQYEKFIKRIMDAKLHIKDKNCVDPLKINQEDEHTYGIATLFAQFVYAGAQNKKIDRYIPIEDIKATLISALGDKCNVEEIIDEYIEEENKQNKIDINSDSSKEDVEKAAGQDPAETFSQIMEMKREQLQKRRDEYDISDCEDLIYYEDGDTMYPGIKEAITSSMRFLQSLLENGEYKELMKKDAKKRCEWIIEQNRQILICDEHWDKVFTNIEENEDAFARYYGLFRVRLDNDDLVNMCIAFMINDELYDYTKILAETPDNEDENK
ncbi:MAG: hypothetical protein MR953_05780 [Butyrivibrio crossotus]|nr:hypothetical protein [Butyrivibrio crossotus]